MPPVKPETHRAEKSKLPLAPAPRSASVGTVVVNTVPWRKAKVSQLKKKKSFSLTAGPPKVAPYLILGERRARDPGSIGKKLVRVQHFVAKVLVRSAVPFIAS